MVSYLFIREKANLEEENVCVCVRSEHTSFYEN